MSARHPQPPAAPMRSLRCPTPHTRGYGTRDAGAAGGACARKGGGGRAPRASRWARPLASVRAPRLLTHVPALLAPLPARSARLPPLRRVPLGLSEAHTPRSFSLGRRLGCCSTPAARASTPQRSVSVLFSALRHSPSFSRPSLPPGLPREPGYEAGGLETGVRKMEVPRLDHALNSPTSPCEEVIKNLSLEAIQLCDRDGKSGRDLKERGQACARAPRPLRLRGPCPPGRHGLLLSPQCK